LGFAGSKGTVFQIKLSEAEPHPNALISNISAFPGEKEVLIFPFFPFVEKSRKIEGNLTFIDL
jgi:hypothetical protein